MKYAIIAAGEGSRLVQEGVAAPKPLVKVGGEMLIDRLIRVFQDNKASEICVICNEQMTAVAAHLKDIAEAGCVPLKYLVKSTPSSMHSMWELSKWLGDEPFILTTVDTIFREDEFKVYANTFNQAVETGVCDGLMGVTDYIDDEKPLYVGTSDEMTITGFYDTCDNPKYISGGIYGLTPKSLDTLRQCIERGDSRMRNFQRALVSDGLKLKAYGFSKVLDIDHASDIQKAEDFLTM
jgi:NDP-sugar pyrophosphorylase family protein